MMLKSKKNARGHLIDAVEKYFPGKSKYLLAMLAAYATLAIKGISQPLPLFIVGQPSSRKSTLCEIMSCLDHTICVDDFSAKAFVSAAPGVADGDREDLLPKLKHKLLITPELGTLFKNKNLKEIMGILTRILDGKGFVYATGVGQVGYRGKFFFAWLAAVVEIPSHVWSILAHLGNRLFFCEIEPESANSETIESNLIEMVSHQRDYDEKISICQSFLLAFLEKLNFEIDSVKWDISRDESQAVVVIAKCANLLRTLRAGQSSKIVEGKRILERPVPEDPARSMQGLYNLARGMAVLDGRNYIKMSDVPMIVKITLDSCPAERRLLFRGLVANEGILTDEEFRVLSQLSKLVIRSEFDKAQNIGLVEVYDKPQPDSKPVRMVKLKPEFDWYLSENFTKFLN